MTTIAKEVLTSLVSRIERLESEKSILGEDIKVVYSEAKAQGFDTKALRKVISLRKTGGEDEETEALVELYMGTLAAPAFKVEGQ